MINIAQYLVNQCNYSGVYEMFNHLYGGSLIKPNGTVGSVPLSGKLSSFDQFEFFDRQNFWVTSASMDNTGYIYIPSGCSINATDSKNEKLCKLAFALHGCSQTRYAIN